MTQTVKLTIKNSHESESFDLLGVEVESGQEKTVELPMATANRLVIAANSNPHITTSAGATSKVEPADGELKKAQERIAELEAEAAVMTTQNTHLTAERDELAAERDDLKAALAKVEALAESAAEATKPAEKPAEKPAAKAKAAPKKRTTSKEGAK